MGARVTAVLYCPVSTSCQQVEKHVLSARPGEPQALRLVLRCLDFLRSLRIDAVLFGGSTKSKRSSRPAERAVNLPNSWGKVPARVCTASTCAS